VILYLSFEELAALSASAESVVTAGFATAHGVVAPPQIIGHIETFAQQLNGDLDLSSLEEHDRMLHVVRHLLHDALQRMDEAVLLQHAAAESAVAAYFTYAHILTVERRLVLLGAEMAAIVNLMTGDDPDSDAARRFSFPEE
jgi:hypothetical protein